MVGALSLRSAPSATGTLAATPLAHALVFARNKNVSGTLTLDAGAGRSATIAFWNGRIVRVDVRPIVAYLSDVVEALGFAERPILVSAFGEALAENKRHGEVLVDRGIVSKAQRDRALVEQMFRRLHVCFLYPPETTYAFFDAPAAPSEPSTSVSPLAAVWRGINEMPPLVSIMKILQRAGDAPLHLVDEDALEAARLGEPELALAAQLRTRAMTLAELRAATELTGARVELLVYFLLIGKCVELGGGSGVPLSVGPLRAAAPPSMTPVRVAAHVNETPASSVRLRTLPEAPDSEPSSKPPSSLSAPMLDATTLVYRAQVIEHEDPFTVLGVRRGATSEDISEAFVRLARAWHPDRLPTELRSFRAEAEKVFAYLSRANDLLSNPATRAVCEQKGLSTQPVQRPRKEIVAALEGALAKREFAFAESEASRLVESDPDDGEAQAMVAWAAARAGESDEDVLRAAIAKLDSAIKKDAQSERGYYYRGVLQKRLGNEPNALKDFQRALQLNPRHVDATREIRLIEMRSRKSEIPFANILSKITRRGTKEKAG